MPTNPNVRVPNHFYRRKNGGGYDYFTGPEAPFPRATGLNLTSLRTGVSTFYTGGIEKVKFFKFGHSNSEETPILDIVWNDTMNTYIFILRDRFIGDRAAILGADHTTRNEYVRTDILNFHNRVLLGGLYYRSETQASIVDEYGYRAVRGVSNFKTGYVYKEVYGGKNADKFNPNSRPFVLVDIVGTNFTYVPIMESYYGQTKYILTGSLSDYGIIPCRYDEDGVAVYNCNMTVAI